MEQPAIRIPLSKLRAFVAILCVFLALLLAGPALAEYLGPGHHRVPRGCATRITTSGR